jgi:peptide chain release factor 1
MDVVQREQQEKIAQNRKAQVGSGERSEKIRTYNFPQSRITDHRLNLSLHNLIEVLDGKLDEIIEKLVLRSQAQMLETREAGAASTKS